MEALLIIRIHALHVLHSAISVSSRALPISCAHNRPVLQKIHVPAQIRALGNEAAPLFYTAPATVLTPKDCSTRSAAAESPLAFTIAFRIRRALSR
jgi:hypothetical protein